jgi:uracil-DNA glycosylase
MPRVSPFAIHCDKWSRGCGSPACSRASSVCHYRGDLPCDVLFCGESPGESENVLGFCFVGPAGMLLDDIIAEALGGIGHILLTPKTCKCDKEGHCNVCDGGLSVCAICGEGESGLDNPCQIRCGFTNLVGCIPYDEGHHKTTEPDVESIMMCAPRLQEIINLANPKLVACVGKLPAEWIDQRYQGRIVTLPVGCKTVNLIHPAAILRAVTAQKSFMRNSNVVQLRRAVIETFGGSVDDQKHTVEAKG